MNLHSQDKWQEPISKTILSFTIRSRTLVTITFYVDVTYDSDGSWSRATKRRKVVRRKRISRQEA